MICERDKLFCVREYFNIIFKTLTLREAKVLKYRYGFDGEKIHTLREVSEIFEITRERVRQIGIRA